VPSGLGIVPTVTNVNGYGAPGGRKSGLWETLRHWMVPGLGVKRLVRPCHSGTALDRPRVAIVPPGHLPRLPPIEHPAGVQPDGVAALAAGRGLRRGRSRALLYGMLPLEPVPAGALHATWAPVARAVAEHRRLGRGPKIVAIGGGNALATLLRGLKEHTGNLTAIVSVADDGGSSGRCAVRSAFRLLEICATACRAVR